MQFRTSGLQGLREQVSEAEATKAGRGPIVFTLPQYSAQFVAAGTSPEKYLSTMRISSMFNT